MKFDELPLYIAIHQVHTQINEPCSEKWTSTHLRDAYKLVLMQLVDNESWTDQGIPWSQEHVREAWMKTRKSPDGKIRLICQVALRHGESCFYSNRGVGDCSEDIDLERLIPETRGGIYALKNCVIACSFHNRSRGDTPIEEFLWKGWEQEAETSRELRQANGAF